MTRGSGKNPSRVPKGRVGPPLFKKLLNMKEYLIENLNKFYTPVDLAIHCWDKTYEVLGADNISESIEPSVGGGAFLHHPDYAPSLAFDIQPDCQSTSMTEVLTQDFLTLDLPYRKGRLFIGNPPFGDRNNLSRAFFNKAVTMGDYIAFILPISQLDNTNSLYKFDLVYSEDLGVQNYSGTDLHCCFNIYRRPESGKVNPKPSLKLKDISIFRHDTKGYAERTADLRMCYWGNSTAGKLLSDGESYSAEYKIVVNNSALKERVIDVLSTYDWESHLKSISMRTISQSQVYDVLSHEIPEIR